MKQTLLKTLFLCLMVLTGVNVWADEETYSPVLDVNFRTGENNTSWNSGYPKDASTENNTTFECNYNKGLFVVQKYTVTDLQLATSLTLTFTDNDNKGVDGMTIWLYPNNDWTAETSAETIVAELTSTIGIAPRSSSGTASSEYLVSGGTKTGSSPQVGTYTFSSAALTKLKAAASSDGTFSLLITNNKLTEDNQRKFSSSNTSNTEAYRPTLKVTLGTATAKNVTTGVNYLTLANAFDAAVKAGTDAEIEVSADQTLTGRQTWNVAKTLTITPKANITITGHTNQMWFLANTNDGKLNIGGSNYTITFDGGNNAMGAYPITKREYNANITLTNVIFQNFDLNNNSALCQGSNADGVMTLENITVKNCKNPAKGFFYNERVVNDKVVLKGYMNINTDCTGTHICATAEYKSDTQVNGRIKVDDDNFTATNPITVDWLTNDPNKNVFLSGISVVVGVKVAFADRFQLTNDSWILNLVNSDLKLATPTAKIGTTNYLNLAAALAAVQDGETITLLADQEVSSRINVKNMSITIDGNSSYAIKRATGYTNGMMFLTENPDNNYSTGLTLKDITIDGQSVSSTAAVMEAGNNGTTILNDVTFKNCVNTDNNSNHQSVLINNKGGGKLTLNGVAFTGCSVASGQAFIFVGTNNVTLTGTNTIASIYLSGTNVLNASSATATSAISLITESRNYGQLVKGATATDFASSSFRLVQMDEDVYGLPLIGSGSFTHPGLLHTTSDITRVKANLTVEPFASAWTELQTESNKTYSASPVEWLKRMDQTNWSGTYTDYNNYTAAVSDAKMAYRLALCYQLSDDASYATAAESILNSWATTCRGILKRTTRPNNDGTYVNSIPDPNEYLICIQAYQFANAAELLRDHMNSSDFSAFKNWMRTTFADVALLFLENHHNANIAHYWANWDLTALTALYSIGVLCDDATLVNYATSYISSGEGMGVPSNIIVATHDDPDSDETLGQCQESGRDQGHSTLDVTLLGVLCQTANNQGNNLFETYNALNMVEYIGKYNLKDASGNFIFAENKVPFTTYTNADGVNHTAISSDSRGKVRPCWELFHAYARDNSKSDIYTKQWVDYMRKQNTYGEGDGTDDELGFGTLMFGEAAATAYTLTVGEAGAATLVLPFGAALPTGVKAYTLSYTAGSNKVTATEVTAITANQPVLINAEAGSYTFTSNGTTNNNSLTTGALTGVYASTVVPNGSYIMTYKDSKVGFRKSDGSTNYVAANRAYLTADGAGAPEFLDVDFGDVTGIRNATRLSQLGQTNQMFDMQGRKVTQPAKGLYIVNGRKVVIK